VTPDTQARSLRPTIVVDSCRFHADDHIQPARLQRRFQFAPQLHYAVYDGTDAWCIVAEWVGNSSFTQADINNGLVGYRETASGVTSDTFPSTSRTRRHMTGTTSFQINIGSPTRAGARATSTATARMNLIWRNDASGETCSG